VIYTLRNLVISVLISIGIMLVLIASSLALEVFQ
jgi:hypothetical protein